MSETIWSLVPPLITIALALYTKEVYISLIVGILTGALMFCNFNVISAIDTMFTIMEAKVGGNVNILVFLVLLGILVAAISRSGASKAYGEWAARSIKGKASALFVTSFLGMLIFIDDYFNCLTVGTVMRPVTDKFKVTRAKLAYIIDATAAPICIIAPVSSWAAAVSSSLPEDSKIDGFQLFLQTIPYNYYAWFTLIFLMFLIWSGKDFATMKSYEEKYGTEVLVPAEYQDEEAEKLVGKGKIIDLVLPLFVLIAGCIFGMLYTGGILEGAGVAQAFADCNSSKGLVIGSFMALAFTFFLYVPRGVLRFNVFCECFSAGFKAMTPALFILCLAWSLSGICGEDYLNIGGYVSQVVGNNATLGMFLPAMFFLVAIGLAFATGTSWGTFGILIPIVLAVIGDYNELTVVTIAAVLAGAVGGDHVSPISDTTILASAGAQCNHLDHVGTQIPYVLVV
ncbi:MAG: Na+/H+ antiporter NhaC family protein, partial [Phascolarctobacterium sp.]|nr:Na+/H+ antiporter NhaC family protein [Phascolarctobacterium sp.]